MKLSYTELMVLSAILRSPTRTLVVTRDHSTYVDQRRLLDALNRKDIFLMSIEDIRHRHALRGLEVSSVVYDETTGALSLTDEERAEVNSRVRLPFGGTKTEIVAVDEAPAPPRVEHFTAIDKSKLRSERQQLLVKVNERTIVVCRHVDDIVSLNHLCAELTVRSPRFATIGDLNHHRVAVSEPRGNVMFDPLSHPLNLTESAQKTYLGAVYELKPRPTLKNLDELVDEVAGIPGAKHE